MIKSKLIRSPLASRNAVLRGGILASVAAAALCGAASPVFAQDTESRVEASGGLEEIVVTARRQAESLMDVPVAASVVGGETLDNLGITNMTGLAQLIPNVSVEMTLGAAGGSFIVRGVGSNGTDAGGQQSVSVNFDGVMSSRGQIIRGSVFDIDQVEVLKGPQALFFGKNSPGGVVSITSRGPTDAFEVSGRVGYEFEAHEKYFETAASGPLSETFGARLAVRGSDMRGWIKNTAQSIPNPYVATIPSYSPILPGAGYNYNSNKELAGRLTLEWEPSTDFRATMRLAAVTQRDFGASATSEIVKCGPTGMQVTAGRIDPFGDCEINGRVAMGSLPAAEGNSEPLFGNDGDPFGRFTSYLASLTMDYSMGPLTLTSVTGYLDYKQRLSESPKTTFSPSNWTGYTDNSAQFSQEFRAISDFDGPVNFTLGAYYEDNKLDTAGSSIVTAHAADPRTGSIATSTKLTTSRGDAYSAYGQMRWGSAPMAPRKCSACGSSRTKAPGSGCGS